MLYYNPLRLPHISYTGSRSPLALPTAPPVAHAAAPLVGHAAASPMLPSAASPMLPSADSLNDPPVCSTKKTTIITLCICQ